MSRSVEHSVIILGDCLHYPITLCHLPLTFLGVVSDFIVSIGLYIMLLKIIEWASKIRKAFHCNRMYCNGL